MLDKAAFESPGVHQVKQLAELLEGNACWTAKLTAWVISGPGSATASGNLGSCRTPSMTLRRASIVTA